MGGNKMKKLFLTAAALTLAFSAIPNLANAAPTGKSPPTKSEYCAMAKSQRNPVAWNAHYNCLDKTAAAAPIVEPKRENRARDPYCNMAKGQRNPVAWNAHYHCLQP
jgi:hypothetical protein